MDKEEILEFVQNEVKGAIKFAERLAAVEMMSKITAAASLAGIVLIIGMIWSMNHNINARMGNLEVQLVKIESTITGLENSFAVFDKRLSAVEIAVTK